MELGPVLFITFLLIFFPMLNLMALAVAFACGSLLNWEETREMALIPTNLPGDTPAQVNNNRQQRLNAMEQAWFRSGFGQYVKVQGGLQGVDSTVNSAQATSGLTNTNMVTVRTSMNVAPFVAIPFPTPVPGLNAPFPMSFTSERPVEE